MRRWLGPLLAYLALGLLGFALGTLLMRLVLR